MTDVVQRFLRYVEFDTSSDEKSLTSPSTPGQRDLAGEIAGQLAACGATAIELSPGGILTALIPANTDQKGPVIGFIAHLDTSPDCAGQGVKPRLVKDYPGGDIVLNKELGLYLSEAEFPELKKYLGQDLLTTDGTTLLGADDKAGIAEIVAAAAYLYAHPEIKHGSVKLAFTPDEEIGRGTDNFDLRAFGADFAYTVDGGELGSLEAENFNAASATIRLTGKNVHPGQGKDKLVNSQLYIKDILEYLPAREIPACTEGYEGFYHLTDIEGSVEKTVLRFLVRDHDRNAFARRKERLYSCCAWLNEKYGPQTAEAEIKDTYYNMKEVLDRYPYVMELAVEAMRAAGVEPVLTPIRGGTDGARLSYMGLPTPNLFTGGHNFHGRYEFIPIFAMEKAVQVIVNICRLGAKLHEF